MNREKALSFVYKHRHTKFYQPVIFQTGVIEIKGKWHQATRQLAKMLFQDVYNKNVLDVGCNTGYFLCEAKIGGAKKVTGIDHDIVAIAQAKQIRDIMELDIDIHHTDLKSYSCSQYDIVIMLNILHTIENPKATVVKYLKVAGELLVIEHDESYEQYFPANRREIIDSPRAHGHRKISFFRAMSDLNIGDLDKEATQDSPFPQS